MHPRSMPWILIKMGPANGLEAFLTAFESVAEKYQWAWDT